ncbi:hypothetical protein [uncultured Dokdonia sp.]|uniref:hypothetical protein n=1 Tax=uncultured Dokdonia sp. TaxID=575653 RepID=UPI002624B976|nr:hypothetical protein [uncultured Dokdonia sp.]
MVIVTLSRKRNYFFTNCQIEILTKTSNKGTSSRRSRRVSKELDNPFTEINCCILYSQTK